MSVLYSCAKIIDCRGPQTFQSEGHISHYTTVRLPDISHNVIVSGLVTFYQINKFFVNRLFFIVDKMSSQAG